MEQQNCTEVQEEIVTPDTTYMCGACYEWFPYIEDFNSHHCSAAAEENNGTQETNIQESCTVYKEDDDLEKDVANILGEMKYSIPTRMYQQVGPGNEVQEGCVQEQSFIINYEVEPSGEQAPKYVKQEVVPKADNAVAIPVDSVVESVEIPSSCIFPYENPVYLNRLMKDNTVGKRVRHDAPYTHRLGPWDNVSTKLLIQFVKEVPAAYFIASDNVKRTEAWELIRYKLSEADHHFTVLQIRMRWRELCKKYRNVVNYNELHGSKRTCQFFNDLNDLFGIWNREATEILIGELASKDIKQNGGLRMRFNTWDKIRKVLFNRGYNYTAHQVHGRWNALVTLYQRMVDRNSNPDAEPFDIAYKDLIEPIFPYVPLKKGKINQTKGNKDSKDRWTVHAERALLQAYTDSIDDFRKSESKHNREVWQQIVESLQKECGYCTTIEKARTRFYELAKYYGTMLRYNSQPGALYRESKHHEILAAIYNRYSLWPHDGSVIKLDNSNARRMRQLNAQLRWTEEESRAVLQLYPQVLTEHLQNSEQQPLEELWVQMAKTLVAVKNITKLPYEIEEQIVLLRRGFKSDNPFPFRAEMEELEETEHSLCFSPEESPSTDAVQMVPYWSHLAAHTLLDYVIHYRQEGVKTLNDNMYEVISMDLESHGYSYTSKECRQYYLLLRKMFKSKLQVSGDEQKDPSSPFPYWDRMVELKTVSQFDYEDSSEIRLKILEAASSKLEVVEGGDDITRQQNMEKNLCQLKIYLMNAGLVRPPPPIKIIAQTLLKFMKNEEVVVSLDTNTYFTKLRTMLLQHMDVLTFVAERGALRNLEKLQLEGKKRQLSRGQKIRSVAIQWNDKNVQSMLTTVKEWRQLCHDEAELQNVLASGQLIWDEVAYNLSRRVKKCPDLCKEYFDMLCDKSAKEEAIEVSKSEMSVSETKDSSISFMNSSTLKSILSPLVSHDAEWDSRDVRWGAETEGWTREETLELLFTVRELLNEDNAVDWEQVRLMMLAGGYDRTADRYQAEFIDLYNGYKRAYTFNKECLVRARRRPPFYFKIHTLFGFKECIRKCSAGAWQSQILGVDEEEVFEVLLAALKDKKNLVCHMLPRLPLMTMLASCVSDHFKNQSVTLSPNQVWHLLVQLHRAQADAFASGESGPFGKDLDGLWQNHPNPLVSYGLQAIPTSGWQWVKNWSVEEISILIDDVIKQCMPDTKAKEVSKIPSIFLYQLGYMLSTFKHGGYQVFEKQLNLLYMLQLKPNSALEENNSILQRVRDNYRKIEDSKAILRSAYGISSEYKRLDNDELSNYSEDSDERDLFSESDFDGELDATDSDEENAHVGGVTPQKRYFKGVNENLIEAKDSIRSHFSSTRQRTDGFQSSPTEKGSAEDYKYVFRVTTNTRLKTAFRTKHLTSSQPAGLGLPPNANIQLVANPPQGNKEKCVKVSLVKQKNLPDDTVKKQIIYSPSGKQIRQTATVSLAINKRSNISGELNQIKKQKYPEYTGTESISIVEQNISDLQSPEKEHIQHNVDQISLVSNTALQNESIVSQESIKRNKRKLQLPQKLDQQKEGNTIRGVFNVGNLKVEDNNNSLTDEHCEEGKEALMELTDQYYKRRRQEKDRLLTAFNSVQESHQQQAKALLSMFDKLQSLL